jgi:hypothetical protein
MSCSCKNSPQPPQSNQKSFLDIVAGNSVTPPNGTYQMTLKARFGEEIYTGTGFLTYISNPNGLIQHYFQTNLDGVNAPFIAPITGKGFLNKYEYQSHHNSNDVIHSYVTNKLNIHNQKLDYHIQAQPASCCCTGNNGCCSNNGYNLCFSCQTCNPGHGCCK